MFLRVALGFALLFWASPTAAQDSVRWAAAPGCPSADEAKAQVASLMAGPIDGAAEVPSAQVVIARGALGEFEARITLGSGANAQVRVLRDAQCAALSHAAAVVVALASERARKREPAQPSAARSGARPSVGKSASKGNARATADRASASPRPAAEGASAAGSTSGGSASPRPAAEGTSAAGSVSSGNARPRPAAEGTSAAGSASSGSASPRPAAGANGASTSAATSESASPRPAAEGASTAGSASSGSASSRPVAAAESASTSGSASGGSASAGPAAAANGARPAAAVAPAAASLEDSPLNAATPSPTETRAARADDRGSSPRTPESPQPPAADSGDTKPNSSPQPVALHITLAGALSTGLVPHLAPLVAAGAGVLLGPARVGLRFAFAPAQRATLVNPAGLGGTVGLVSLGLEGGLQKHFGAFELPAIAGLEVGLFSASSRGIPESDELAHTTPWLAVRLGSGLTWWFSERMGIGLQLEGIVSLLRPSFALQGPDNATAVFHRPSLVSGRALLQTELRLP